MGIEGLAPHSGLLITGLLIDAVFGDPQVRFHPIRLVGNTLSFFEDVLRRVGADGYKGGCALFAVLALVWVAIPSVAVHYLYLWNPVAGSVVHVAFVFVLFALRDLMDHIRAVQAAAQRVQLRTARLKIGFIVGRDTDKMDLDGCRRSAIESLSENFVDGFLSPLFWYVVAGLPGLLLFKVVSTMDSMVGYITPRYLKFGWCGAWLDDVMNFIPARIGWFLLGLSALPFRGLSARKGWRIGLRQNSLLPGPNPGWSEATMAGVLQRRLIGPVWQRGTLITDLWIGDPADPVAGSDEDLSRALWVVAVASCLALLYGAALLQRL